MFKKIQFEVTADHVKLLRRAYVSWFDAEYGAPCVDPKRPYGNSDVEGDICEILGWKFDEDEGPSDAQCKKARKIHDSTKQALQIFLSTGEMRAGVYEADEYRDNWTRVK